MLFSLLHIPKVERQDLCPPAPLHGSWLRYEHLEHNFTVQWFRCLTGKTHKHLKSCWIAPELRDRNVHRQPCKRQPPAPANWTQHPLATATLSETPPRWSLQKQFLPSCQALWKLGLSPWFVSLTHVPTWQLPAVVQHTVLTAPCW